DKQRYDLEFSYTEQALIDSDPNLKLYIEKCQKHDEIYIKEHIAAVTSLQAKMSGQDALCDRLKKLNAQELTVLIKQASSILEMRIIEQNTNQEIL
ncbi:MAG: hypothetical protein AAGF26_20085, partial [Cyanobacteria bacterium P01_G01_bin.49]